MAKKKHHIMIVDDQPYVREELAEVLGTDGRSFFFASEGVEALEKIHQIKPDLVITDIHMPGMDGFELIRKSRQLFPSLPVIAITAYGSTETATNALRVGAYDFVTKPFSVEEIRNLVKNTLQAENLFEEINYLKGRLQQRYALENIIGQCPEMQKVFDTINKVAQASCNVLITGESGTGKELVAQAIHHRSPRAAEKFVPINCASIPEGLLESELFGHVKGSFTDAVAEKQGLVQAADHGTLFLDEIGDMPLPLQVRLLRVIQNRQVQKVGSTNLEDVDVRIIAATNQDLGEKIHQRLFREDLYYRINVIEIKLPPLRNRGSDIILLTSRFLKKYSERLNKHVTQIDPNVYDLFQRYPWPGNVRELENALERAVTLCRADTITFEDIPPAIKDHLEYGSAGTGSLTDRVNSFEQKCLAAALEKNSQDLDATAAELQISIATLYRKLKKHNLPVPSKIIELSRLGPDRQRSNSQL